MNPSEVKALITSIINGNKSILGPDYDSEYRRLAKLFHPDGVYGHYANAEQAMQKLVDFKTECEKGTVYVDESGDIYHKDNILIFKGNRNKNLLYQNYDKYNNLIRAINYSTAIDSTTKDVIKRYLPEAMYIVGDELHVKLLRRSVYVLNSKFEEKHVRWIMNRLFDIAGYMSLFGYNHLGLSPYSVLITPEDHGLQVVTFYHTTQQNHTIETISGLIKRWYPEKLFKEKISNSTIDSGIIKLFGCCLLLGGLVNDPIPELRGHIDDGLLNFLSAEPNLVITDSLRYREFLDLKPKEFFVLDL